MIIENEKLKELGTKLQDLNQNISDIENKEIVKLYNRMKSEREKTSREYEQLVSNIQNECNHKFWYHLSTSSDDYEGRTYFTCKCLDCDFVTEDRSRSFGYVIDTKENFYTVQSKYQEFRKITKDDDTLYRLLKEHFQS
jgi:ABC-type uncharacterized transport system fused permease/ATPase subunit